MGAYYDGLRRLWLDGGDRAARPDSTRLSSVPVSGLWIPMMPPGHTEVKASTCSNLMPSTVLR